MTTHSTGNQTGSPTPPLGTSAAAPEEIPGFIGELIAKVPQEQQAPIREFKGWANLKEPAALLKSYVDTQSEIGKLKRGQMIDAPTTPEKRAELEKKFPRGTLPAKPEEYQIEALKSLPAELKMNDKVMGRVLGKAHGMGITQEEMNAVLGEYFAASVDEWKTQNGAALQSVADRKSKAIGALKAKYGDNYEERIRMGQDLAAEAFKDSGDEMLQAFMKSPLDNDPDLMSWMIGVAEMTGYDKIVKGRAPAGSGSGVDSLDAQIKTKRAEKSYGTATPEGRKLAEEVFELEKQKVVLLGGGQQKDPKLIQATVSVG